VAFQSFVVLVFIWLGDGSRLNKSYLHDLGVPCHHCYRVSSQLLVEFISGVNKGKTESQTRNCDISCFRCLGVGYIASQCPNKRTIITRADREVETESKGNDDQMPLLEDVCDDEVEYPMKGESFVARRA
jgi:hypothetical protein